VLEREGEVELVLVAKSGPAQRNAEERETSDLARPQERRGEARDVAEARGVEVVGTVIFFASRLAASGSKSAIMQLFFSGA